MTTRDYYINKLREVLSHPAIFETTFEYYIHQSQYWTVERIITVIDSYNDWIEKYEEETYAS